MGAFNDAYQAIKALLKAPVTFAGTMISVSEETPTVVAQNVQGGTFVVPNLDALADIPYDLLQKDMEVIVPEYDIDVETVHPRTKYYLAQMPTLDTRVKDMPGFVLSNYWVEVITGSEEEPDPEPGPPGNNGWTPVFANENDGSTRVVERLVEYVGGTGSAPVIDPNQSYLGPSGLTTKPNATNKRGTNGSDANVRPLFVLSDGNPVRTPAISQDAQISVTPASNRFILLQALDVLNNSSAFRYFRVRGFVYVARNSFNQYATLVLIRRDSAKLPGVTEGANFNIDASGYTEIDWKRILVDAPVSSLSSYDQVGQKIEVEETFFCQPNETRSVYLALKVYVPGAPAPSSSQILRTQGYIEVTGL